MRTRITIRRAGSVGGRRRAWRLAAIAMVVAIVAALSGCMYPEDATPGNDASARQAVLSVQDAVDRYREATGLLPIINAEESVPLYEKYKIDLGKLKRMGYLGSVPGAAFENGGSNQFLIIDEETKPTVKLLSIPVYQNTQAVQAKVDAYVSKHGGKAPAGDELYPGFWSLDFGKIGGGSSVDKDVTSMFSRQTLGYMVDAAGTVYVDYGIDIATAVKKAGRTPGSDEDLRRALVDASYFVPVKSPVYRWIGDEPVAQAAAESATGAAAGSATGAAN